MKLLNATILTAGLLISFSLIAFEDFTKYTLSLTGDRVGYSNNDYAEYAGNNFWWHKYVNSNNSPPTDECTDNPSNCENNNATHTGIDYSYNAENTKNFSIGFGKAVHENTDIGQVSIRHLITTGNYFYSSLLHNRVPLSVNINQYVAKNQEVGIRSNTGVQFRHLHLEISNQTFSPWIMTNSAVPRTYSHLIDNGIDVVESNIFDSNMLAHYDTSNINRKFYNPIDFVAQQSELIPQLSLQLFPLFNSYDVFGYANQPIQGFLNLSGGFDVAGMIVRDLSNPNINSREAISYFEDLNIPNNSNLGELRYNQSLDGISDSDTFTAGNYLVAAYVKNNGENRYGYPVKFSFVNSLNNFIIDNDQRNADEDFTNDNNSALTYSGDKGSPVPGYFLTADLHSGKSNKKARWRPNRSGFYQIWAHIPERGATATAVTYKIVKGDGTEITTDAINQNTNGGEWVHLIKNGNLGQIFELSSNNNGYVELSLESSTGGANATILSTQKVAFDAMKFVFIGSCQSSQNKNTSINEKSVGCTNTPPDAPSTPSPLNNSGGVSVATNLSWAGSDPDGDALTYDVYLESGDTTPDVLVCNDVAVSSCQISGNLISGVKYYWKVVASDSVNTNDSPVWSFTTSDIAILDFLKKESSIYATNGSGQNNFYAEFKLKNNSSASTTINSIAIAIYDSNSNFVKDCWLKTTSTTISANGTYATGQRNCEVPFTGNYTVRAKILVPIDGWLYLSSLNFSVVDEVVNGFDLITSLSMTNTNPIVGENVIITSVTTNIGDTTSPGGYYLYYYTSNDPIISVDDNGMVGPFEIPSLSNGASYEHSGSLNITPDLAGSSYWFGSCLIVGNGEVNSLNNCSNGVQMIVGGAGSCSYNITAPNGGESVRQGHALPGGVQWTFSGSDCDTRVNIDLYKNGLFHRHVTSSDVNNDGNWTFIASNNDPVGNIYKLRVIDNANSSYFDESDDFFTIYDPNPTPQCEYNILSPNGEGLWYLGESRSIRWGSNKEIADCSSTVSIDLYKNGVNYAHLYTTANDGNKSWSISSSLPASNLYKIRVSDTNNPSIFAESDTNFTLLTPASNSDLIASSFIINNYSPQVGEQINFIANLGNIGEASASNVIARYYSSNNSGFNNPVEIGTHTIGFLPIGATVVDTLNFTPSGVAGETSWYRVCLDNASNESNTGNNCSTIRSITLATINLNCAYAITSPNGGENWQASTTHSITWNKSGNDCGSTVKLELHKNGLFDRNIGVGTVNDGSFSWSVDSQQATSNAYKVKIIDDSNPTFTDISNSDFSITTSENCSYTVLTPNGGENYESGSTQTIEWSHSGSDCGNSVKIELYNNGVLDYVIASNAPNTNSFNWPMITGQADGSNYRIKISDGSYFDESDSDFTISLNINNEPAPVIVSPDDGSIQSTGGFTINGTSSLGVGMKLSIYQNNTLIGDFCSGIYITGNWECVLNLLVGNYRIDAYHYSTLDNSIISPIASINISIVDLETDTIFKNGMEKIEATNPLNDTGITWGGDYPSGNNTTCTSNISAPQDCNHGRDSTQNDDSDGHSGFSFTKLDISGNELPTNALQWSCVRDNVTGLVWEVKTIEAGIHNKSNSYRWGGITRQGNYGTEFYDDWDSLVNGSNNENLCGFNDWRVPTVQELLSIVDYSTSIFDVNYNDSNYFPNYEFRYWSVSPYAIDDSKAWVVNRYPDYENRLSSGRVRLVH